MIAAFLSPDERLLTVICVIKYHQLLFHHPVIKPARLVNVKTHRRGKKKGEKKEKSAMPFFVVEMNRNVLEWN